MCGHLTLVVFSRHKMEWNTEPNVLPIRMCMVCPNEHNPRLGLYWCISSIIRIQQRQTDADGSVWRPEGGLSEPRGRVLCRGGRDAGRHGEGRPIPERDLVLITWLQSGAIQTQQALSVYCSKCFHLTISGDFTAEEFKIKENRCQILLDIILLHYYKQHCIALLNVSKMYLTKWHSLLWLPCT